ncbi:hypothetical protein ELE36_08840 [Pseudolysobacter antarcticus]|uniref:DUF697 domain-containing protein n=1 Tax=Pseudolysobacter antarcticus TaxID=2511995 RepID=A0A411HIY7_9GAMM|nr:hypothetical protein [Pseudolysobacter antarcticus]QBB70463.1 hypothetical protein ELE36_08840 [Pseudolysobacter antarcticus]
MPRAKSVSSSTQTIARRATPATATTRDKAFRALLRRKCLRAAGIGALTSVTDIVPGVSRVLGLLFGELLDVKLLSNVQRELIEETLSLYAVALPAAEHQALIKRMQWAGGGGATAVDAMGRRALSKLSTRLGGGIARRLAPFAAALSSALSNAAITYAIGKRAQLAARSNGTALHSMPETLRALTGVDERRILAWSLHALKELINPLRYVIGRRKDKAARKSAVDIDAATNPAIGNSGKVAKPVATRKR